MCYCAVAGRGCVTCLSLLLLLCIDVLLVCAEGCTQVTGVMAMMMTGRVLLVCALCVLWCGADGGECSEPTPVPPASQSEDRNTPKSEKETIGGAGGGGQSGQLEALQAAGLSVQEEKKAETPLRTGTQLSPETADAEKKGEEQTREVEDVGEKKDEEQEKKEEEEEEDGIEQVEEEEEEEEEEKRDDKKEEEGEKKENDTGTTKGMSAGSEEQPSSPSGAEGASNKTKPQSTQTTGDGDSASDGAGTAEEKQNENKDANPKETPVEATAMKNTTATTGDSDSSTAVPHTTSPLLLLPVIACAAAVVTA
ncbi:hypothetical protein ECC02_011632 [Trypanosoma cruzi]|uniref:Mucin-associated surface protein (MASP) n=1 Tax=Trypanosoma cruzi TaxID=5693 RepID=A0A7J6XN47_TRYCR|nr:hypothetical protein ECC02_011632 [Trypanosoma cruzi]